MLLFYMSHYHHYVALIRRELKNIDKIPFHFLETMLKKWFI